MAFNRNHSTNARTGAISAAAVIAATTLTGAPAHADAPTRSTPVDSHARGLPAGAPGLGSHAGSSHAGLSQAQAAPVVLLRAAPAAASAVVPAARTATTTHVVKRGDTVWDLAKHYGSTVTAIVDANDLDSRATIRIGERLAIPTKETKARSTSSTTTQKSAGTHVVVAGDTVWDLAERHGTTVSAIVKANDLNAQAVIRVGQRLTIPGMAATSTKSSSTKKSTSKKGSSAASSLYTVRAGDTLSRIASRFGTTVSAIAKANSIANPSLIREGQVLTISGKVPTGSAPTNLVGDTFLGRTYAKDVVRSANINKAILNETKVPSRAQMRALVVKTAKKYGVDPALAQAIAYQESGFNMRAVSPANAVGTMQVIPGTGEWMSQVVGRHLDLLDPEDNVTAGVALLSYLTQNASNRDQAIAGYYQGLSGVRKYGMNPDTKQYVAAVKAHMKKFR